MSKYYVLAVVKIDGERLDSTSGVVELDDDFAAPLVKDGFVAFAPADAEVTETVAKPARKRAATKKVAR